MISADTPSRKRELSRILCLSMMLLLAIALLATGLYLWGNTLRATLALPRIQFDNEEAALLYQSQRLHSGETIYRTPQAMMAAPNVYPPVYFLLTAPFTSPDATSLAPGRVLSAISFILILFLVFTATLGKPFRRMTRFDFAAGLVAAGLITLTYEALRWSFFYRVDMLAIALSLAGLIILTTSRQRPGTTRIVCSLILLTAGFYTKQTMLAAPLTACIFLLLRDRRTGIRFACAFGALCLTLFCVLYVLTDGNYLRLTISANVNKFVFHDVIIWLKHLWFFYHYWLIAAGLLFIMAIINRRHLFHNPWPVYLIATLPRTCCDRKTWLCGKLPHRTSDCACDLHSRGTQDTVSSADTMVAYSATCPAFALCCDTIHAVRQTHCSLGAAVRTWTRGVERPCRTHPL